MASNSALGPELPSGYSFSGSSQAALTICLPIWSGLSPARIGKASYDDVHDSMVPSSFLLNSWLSYLLLWSLHDSRFQIVCIHYDLLYFTAFSNCSFEYLAIGEIPGGFSLSTSMSNLAIVS